MVLEGYSLRLSRKLGTFERLAGLSVPKFSQLLKDIAPIWVEAEHKRLSKAPRKRDIGAGNSYKLPLCDILLMLLIYYRTYITHEFLGFLFKLDNSNVGRCINRLNPCLAKHFRIPERKIISKEEAETLFFDGTEQPIQRPKKKKARKSCYSGKKKRHTLKIQAVSNDKEEIRAVSKSLHGRKHDKKIYDQTRVVCPPNSQKVGDTAYIGTSLKTPHKKPKGGELTTEQKQENREISSKRVVVEHAIGRMKRFQILAQRFRNPRKSHTLIVKNIAGLANLAAA